MTTLPQIVSHKEAVESGLKLYFTGKPCLRGHLGMRETKCRRCVECCNENARNRRKDPEVRKRVKAYRRTPAVRESQRLQMKKWRTEHPEEWKVLSRRSRSKPSVKENRRAREQTQEGKQLNALQARNWRKNNPEKQRALSSKAWATRQNRINSSFEHYTGDDLIRIYKLQNGKCAYCKQPLEKKYEVDHIIPLSKDGSNAARNIQLCCASIKGKRSCNHIKLDKNPMDFARSLGMLL